MDGKNANPWATTGCLADILAGLDAEVEVGWNPRHWDAGWRMQASQAQLQHHIPLAQTYVYETPEYGFSWSSHPFSQAFAHGFRVLISLTAWNKSTNETNWNENSFSCVPTTKPMKSKPVKSSEIWLLYPPRIKRWWFCPLPAVEEGAEKVPTPLTHVCCSTCISLLQLSTL